MKKNPVTFIDQPARNFIETALRESVFVEASAGTGKTYELEQRATNLFCDPVLDLDPSRMAVITFTKAAASELKYRIRHALEKKLRTLPDLEKERLASKISRLESAGISTIHSFCLELLREMPVEFGIDPDVEILGEEESELLFSEVLSDVLREFDSRPWAP
jgi:ATP-dependent helicase/nuclease subunit A